MKTMNVGDVFEWIHHRTQEKKLMFIVVIEDPCVWYMDFYWNDLTIGFMHKANIPLYFDRGVIRQIA